MNEVVQNGRHMQKDNHHRNDHQSFTLRSIFVFDYHIKLILQNTGTDELYCHI